MKTGNRMLKKIDDLIHKVEWPVFMILFISTMTGLSILLPFVLMLGIGEKFFIMSHETRDFIMGAGFITAAVIAVLMSIILLIRHRTYLVDAIGLLFMLLLYLFYFSSHFAAIYVGLNKLSIIDKLNFSEKSTYTLLVGFFPVSSLDKYLLFAVSFILSILLTSITLIPFRSICARFSYNLSDRAFKKSIGMEEVLRGFSLLFSITASYTVLHAFTQIFDFSFFTGFIAAIELVSSFVMAVFVIYLSELIVKKTGKVWSLVGLDPTDTEREFHLVK